MQADPISDVRRCESTRSISRSKKKGATRVLYTNRPWTPDLGKCCKSDYQNDGERGTTMVAAGLQPARECDDNPLTYYGSGYRRFLPRLRATCIPTRSDFWRKAIGAIGVRDMLWSTELSQLSCAG
jgi:hypothetical protein